MLWEIVEILLGFFCSLAERKARSSAEHNKYWGGRARDFRRG